MPLSQAEKAGFTALSHLISDADLINLSDTITRKQITVSSRQEAIDSIAAFSNSATELLSRQKVKKEVLFKYLFNKQIPLPVSSNKPEVITKVLLLWSQNALAKNTEAASTTGSVVPQAASATGSVVPPSVSPYGSLPHQVPHGLATNLGHTYQETTLSIQYKLVQSNQTVHQREARPASNQDEDEEEDLQTFAETFVKWFFENLNSFNPVYGKVSMDFGPNHFMADASMILLIQSGTSPSKENIVGPLNVSQRILNLVKIECLLFNPNCSKDGVWPKKSPHGLTVILVCGTLHKDNKCVGLFDQMFGLIKDPISSSWKIQVTKLKLSATEVQALPTMMGKSEEEVDDLAAI